MIADSGVLQTDVPFGALGQYHSELADELGAAFDRVIRNSSFVLGEEVDAFEREFAEYCEVAHCVGVASGTAALTLSLSAAGIGPGDEVIVPAHTFIASALAVIHAGAEPVLCDVNEADGLIDAERASQVVTERTAALIAVHLYGQICEMEPLQYLAERKGLLLVEDAAQAHGARLDGRRAGSLGDVAGFSFYPGKNLGALGDGGAICTDNDEIAAKARRMRDLGRSSHGLHQDPGFNERLDGLQAAFLRVKLEDLDARNKRRREHADLYRDLLPQHVQPLDTSDERCVFHLFPIRVSNRDELRARLAEAGIQSGIHYSPALHEQPALSQLAPMDGLSNASEWAARELSLPIYPELDERQLSHVAEEVGAHAL